MLLEKFTEFTDKNPRAALNIAVVAALVWVAGIALMLFNRGDNITEKKDLRINELLIEVAAANRRTDSVAQAGLLKRIEEKDANYIVVSDLNSKLKEKVDELELKNKMLQSTGTANNRLARSISRKTKEVTIKLKENEN